MLEMPNEKEFTELYLSHANITDLAIKYFVSTGTIEKWIKKFGLIKIGKYLKKEDLENLINKGTTYTEMQKLLDCSHATLKIYIKKFGLEVNKNIIDIDEMYELRVNKKWTFNELAELYKTSNQMIQNRCRENNFPKVQVERQKNNWQIAFGKKSIYQMQEK